MKIIEDILKKFKGKTIIIFGGTGTIGSLIVEYIRDFDPKTIRVFSNDENSLWEAQQKWRDMNDEMRYILGDIRDYERVKSAMKGVDYAFNCAAIKHVPYAEYNPLEAVHVNIDGLENIIKTCIEYDVKKLLHVSTDKAVEPTTVMGCTKRIGERLLQMRWSQNPTINMVCVRLGNVYGSRGSIIQIVRERQKMGIPIEITSLEMRRFFMKPQEVIEFIIKAFMNGNNGEIWIPQLKPELLIDVIRREVGHDNAIEVVGLRKCEKLQENLFFPHEMPDLVDHGTYWVVKNDFKEWI